MAASPTASGFRFHSLDWLRCGAFLLLVWLHTADMFSEDEWHLHVPWKLAGIEAVIAFFSQWRMPLIFLVSGAGLSFSLDRTNPSDFFSRSVRRLLAPLLFGMVLLIPPVLYWEQLGTPGAVSFWGSYPVYFKDFAHGQFRWLHLWYLGYLLVFCGAVAVGWRPSVMRAVSRLREMHFDKALGPLALAIGLSLPLCLSEWLVRPHFPVRRNLVSDVASVICFFFTFLYGSTWIRNRSFLELLVHFRVLLGLLAAGCYALVARLEGSAEGPELMLVGLNTWLWLMTVVGFATRHLNRKNTWVTDFNRIVFPFYLIHQFVTFAVARLLFPLANVNPWLVYVLLNLLIIGACLLVIYHVLLKLPPWLQPIVGLRAGDFAKHRAIAPVTPAPENR